MLSFRVFANYLSLDGTWQLLAYHDELFHTEDNRAKFVAMNFRLAINNRERIINFLRGPRDRQRCFFD